MIVHPPKIKSLSRSTRTSIFYVSVDIKIVRSPAEIVAATARCHRSHVKAKMDQSVPSCSGQAGTRDANSPHYQLMLAPEFLLLKEEA